ncbi:MAG: hypothetical protein ACE5E6_02045, partial [Phycisphaerae bacterium]
PGGRVQPTRTEPASLTEPPQYGYVIDGAGGDIHRALVRLFDHACKPRVASKPFTIGGRRFERGTVLLRRHENPETLASVLRDIVTDMAVDIRGVDTALSQDGPDLGGRRFHLLQPPRVAIASQWPLATTSFGSTWFLLDARLGLRTSPVNVQRIGSIDLRKYNVLILPHAWNTGSLAAVLGDAAVRRIKAWVESGGTLIAIGGAAAFAAGKDRGLSSVRLRRDVLDKLDVYNDALRQERAARRVVIRPDAIWGTTPQTRAPAHADARQAGDKAGVDAAVKTGTSVVGETGADAGVSGGADTGASAWRDVGAKPRPTNTAATTPPEVADAHAAGNGRPNSGSGNSNKDADARRRRDEWQRMFSPDGTMLAAELDPEHWLAFGAGAKLPVLVSGGYVYMSKYPVATPVRLVEARRLRLSGLLWPEARKRHADSAYATVERVGRGQIILFASDPFFRGYFEGTGRLLLNAVLLGPGMGTSAAVPW